LIKGVRVLDFTTGVAGPYCTKVLADAGADVVKVEPPEGDPLRRRRSGGLFEYLNASKRSVTTGYGGLVTAADVVVTGRPDDAAGWHQEHPGLVAVSISPFGHDGPWVGRPCSEFTLQAACGSLGSRGLPEMAPLAAGGLVGEWLTGAYAAVATLAAIGIDPDGGVGPGTGPGRHVDVAMLDCMAVTLVTYPSVLASFAGWPPLRGTGRMVEVPSVEPTEDGFVVFTTNSAQQFQDFLVMIGRPDWAGDTGLARAAERFARRQEFLEAVHLWSRARTSEQALSEAALLRIPAGPVLNGSTVADFEQFEARGVFRRSPSGRFRQPRPPYRIDEVDEWALAPAPGTGADNGRVDWGPREARDDRLRSVGRGRAPGSPAGLPLSGIRVIDCTAWWAGPTAAHILACLGADVIKVESVKRPDLMRMSSTRPPSEDGWSEWGFIFHPVNASKRGVTLDLTRPEGVDVFERLVVTADVVIENYTPRVMEQFGLGWPRLREVNPRLVMVRMPAFGLDGPWRDRTGFAQTMECISGMAWVTGFPDGPPVLPRGPCDPLAGTHAVLATILALRAREADGKGRLVESTMVEAALNAAAEQIIEWDASGDLLDRQGMRGPGAPQGVYRCAGDDQWVAIAVETDRQWQSLCRATGIADDPRWSVESSRRADADEVDRMLSSWCAGRAKEDAADALVGEGVPAAPVIPGREIAHNPQLRHRGLFEMEVHPVTGSHELPTMPFRFSDVTAWMYRPAPTLGQHNDEVLGEVASPAELVELRRAGVIGERPAGL
jgi:crotonobetainyl-CoA:carnitine CoA-transferase CaiB-like acyl-CoA transferase